MFFNMFVHLLGTFRAFLLFFDYNTVLWEMFKGIFCHLAKGSMTFPQRSSQQQYWSNSNYAVSLCRSIKKYSTLGTADRIDTCGGELQSAIFLG